MGHTAKKFAAPKPSHRLPVLTATRNLKMADSAHAYVRGNTSTFYNWLDAEDMAVVPEGPPIWICGDCHIGNLGPIADAHGNIEVQIRDLDQTVIGNPAHDLLRLGLSLASAARSSDLAGVTTANMIENMMEGYESAFNSKAAPIEKPDVVKVIMKQAQQRTWRHLAQRIEGVTPKIPRGRHFWPISAAEEVEIKALFEKEHLRRLVTMLRSRDDDAKIKVVDAAYWMKGCSSLGLLRFAVLLSVGKGKKQDLCLMDIKEAIKTVAPKAPRMKMPADNAERVVEGARHMSPNLGDRMRAAKLLGKSVFIRELLPQDMKLEFEQLSSAEAKSSARFLASVVGKAHARQMNDNDQSAWRLKLEKQRSKTLGAPSWLWSAIVSQLQAHEGAYLEHCRKYALSDRQ